MWSPAASGNGIVDAMATRTALPELAGAEN
jgi:hypothetical protein